MTSVGSGVRQSTHPDRMQKPPDAVIVRQGAFWGIT